MSRNIEISEVTLGVQLWFEGVACQVALPFKIPWACHFGSKAWHARGEIEDGVPLE